MKIKSILLIVIAVVSFSLLLVGCEIVPVSGGVAVEPAVVYVAPAPVIVEPAYVDVVVPGIWIYEGGHRVWHGPRHERHRR